MSTLVNEVVGINVIGGVEATSEGMMPTLYGSTPYKRISTGTDNVVIKNSAGIVRCVNASNINASPRYVKLYDKATAPDPSQDTPIAVLLIPGATTGGLNVLACGPKGLECTVGIAINIVTTSPDNGATGVAAGDVIVNVIYD